MMPNDVRTADHVSKQSADYRARRPSNNGTSASADTDAFQSPGLSHDRRDRQQYRDRSNLQRSVHDATPSFRGANQTTHRTAD
jgi:hypothetical protein